MKMLMTLLIITSSFVIYELASLACYGVLMSAATAVGGLAFRLSHRYTFSHSAFSYV